MYELCEETMLAHVCNVPIQIDNKKKKAFSDVFPLRYPSSGISESQRPK